MSRKPYQPTVNVHQLLRAFAAAMTLSAVNTMAVGATQAPPICAKDDSGLTMPAGFCATIFADGIGHARHLAVAPDGTVYVNTWSGVYFGNDEPHAGGFLVALKDTTGSGKADLVQRFGETVKSGGAGGTGIALYDGALFAEINDRIVRYELTADSMLPSAPPRVVVKGLPLGGDHPMHPFAIDADGMLYVDVGSASNSCQPKNRTLESPGDKPCTELLTRGGVWRYDANKTDQVFSTGDRFATGIRNAEGFAIDRAGKRVFVTQHGRDQLHSNWPSFYSLEQEATLPAEELMLLHKGGDYGWPECYFDPVTRRLVLAPEYGGDGKRVGECAQKTAPVAYFPAHWAPNGMVYYDHSQFPTRYRNGVLVAFHGSWNRAPFAQKGYNVVFQGLTGDRSSGKCEIFADGFAGSEKSPEKAAHRPTGLALAPDGALFISDDVTGRIYRVVYRGGTSSGKASQGVPCPNAADAPGEIPVSIAATTTNGTGNSRVPDTSALSIPEGDTRQTLELGDQIFHGQVGGASCVGCHGSNASGTPLGPTLRSSRKIWSDGSVAGIAATIRVGVAQPKNYRAPMPPAGGAQLTADQVSALASYVWALGQPVVPAATTANPAAQLIIPGEDIYPESLTAAADGRVIISSIVTRQIFAVKSGAAVAEPWIPAGPDASLGVFGVFADDRANALWACLSAYADRHASSHKPATLVRYDLQTGHLISRYELPTAGAFCNDIAVGEDGAIYVTDTDNMQIVRLGPGEKSLTVWASGGFGPKGGVIDGIAVNGKRLFVNTLTTNKIFSVPIRSDGTAGAIVPVVLSRAIDAPDGMRSWGTDSLLLAESGGGGRLSQVKINGDKGEVTTLKEGFPGGPVSVTVVGTKAFVLEGQLGALFDPSKSPPLKPPFLATAVDVGRP